MIIDLPDDLYVNALTRCQEFLSSPEKQIEFWCRLGNAILDNPELDTTLIVELIQMQMQTRTQRTLPTKPAEYNEKIIESMYFSATCAVLTPQAHTGVVRTLIGLLEDDSFACRLQGELLEYSFFQWCDSFQLFQLGFKRDYPAGNLTALSLARKYVGF